MTPSGIGSGWIPSLVAVALWACSDTPVTPPIATPTTPVQRADGWPTGALADHGIDPERIGLLEREITHGDLEEIHALVIARHGTIVYEGYFVPETGIDNLHVLNSATKSVAATLIGIATQQGLVRDHDQPIAEFFPDDADLFDEDPRRRDIRLSHVLTMSAGLEWDVGRHPSELDTHGRRVLEAADPVRYVIARPVVDEPGTAFLYSGGLSILLTAIVRNVAGVEADTFAARHLFGPLGVTNFDWLHTTSGLTIGDYGLRLTARGLAKIGQLYLQRGRWAGSQILAEEWVDAAVHPWIESYQAMTWYGFQWWLNGLQDDVGNIPRRNDIWVASGYGGQKLFVVPSLDLVVVFFGCSGTYECGMSDSIPHVALYNYILRAIE
jgi:CubicO group peptidase (beta-lactamase class C family)